MHEPSADGVRHLPRADDNTAAFRRAGTPGGGGYATALAMAAFYQMMLGGGRLNGVRLLSTRMVEYVTRNVTGAYPQRHRLCLAVGSAKIGDATRAVDAMRHAREPR